LIRFWVWYKLYIIFLSKRYNEKFRGLKTQANYDTIGVKEGLFTNGCKKTLKLVRIAKKITLKR
jgi:hypothetical protein